MNGGMEEATSWKLEDPGTDNMCWSRHLPGPFADKPIAQWATVEGMKVHIAVCNEGHSLVLTMVV